MRYLLRTCHRPSARWHFLWNLKRPGCFPWPLDHASPPLIIAHSVRFPVATRSDPVPAISCTIISPMEIGGVTHCFLISSITGKMASLGISGTVFTGRRRWVLYSVSTVEVMVRLGSSTSCLAYLSPLGHVLPFTDTIFPSSISTLIWHPSGQLMQVSSLFVILSPLFRSPHCTEGQKASPSPSHQEQARAS